MHYTTLHSNICIGVWSTQTLSSLYHYLSQLNGELRRSSNSHAEAGGHACLLRPQRGEPSDRRHHQRPDQAAVGLHQGPQQDEDGAGVGRGRAQGRGEAVDPGCGGAAVAETPQGRHVCHLRHARRVRGWQQTVWT